MNDIITELKIFVDTSTDTATQEELNNQLKRFSELDNTMSDCKEYLKYIDIIKKNNTYKCCQNCPNNPLVNKFASGICNCTLPYLEQITY